jgi:hypothetical protein
MNLQAGICKPVTHTCVTDWPVCRGWRFHLAPLHARSGRAADWDKGDEFSPRRVSNGRSSFL